MLTFDALLTALLTAWFSLNRKAASGVDKVTVKQFEEDLVGNLENLLDRLKRKSYKAKLVKRKYIPKENGKFRPLGIPALEDKIVQKEEWPTFWITGPFVL